MELKNLDGNKELYDSQLKPKRKRKKKEVVEEVPVVQKEKRYRLKTLATVISFKGYKVTYEDIENNQELAVQLIDNGFGDFIDEY